MRNLVRHPLRLGGILLLAGAGAVAQEVAVEVPDSVPLQVVEKDFSDSEFERRGGAMVIELAGSIRFRHLGEDPVRAVTLSVEAGNPALGSRAVVAVPSLHARGGEEFEIRLSLRLLRPLPLPPGPAVRITTDAVLFESLSAAGPDRLDSVRKMTVRELEARRDREHFLERLEAEGRDGLVAAMQASLQRQAARPRMAVGLAVDGPATAGTDAREVQFAFVRNPDAPVALEAGRATVRGAVSDTPRIRIRNRSERAVRHVELGWLVRDGEGATYSAGAAPVSLRGQIAPGGRFETGGERRFSLRPATGGQTVSLESMAAYVRAAQFEDGTVWIPSRAALAASRVLDTAPVSDEERRLSQLYREQGPAAVAEQLRKLSRSESR